MSSSHYLLPSAGDFQSLLDWSGMLEEHLHLYAWAVPEGDHTRQEMQEDCQRWEHFKELVEMGQTPSPDLCHWLQQLAFKLALRDQLEHDAQPGRGTWLTLAADDITRVLSHTA